MDAWVLVCCRVWLVRDICVYICCDREMICVYAVVVGVVIRYSTYTYYVYIHIRSCSCSWACGLGQGFVCSSSSYSLRALIYANAPPLPAGLGYTKLNTGHWHWSGVVAAQTAAVSVCCFWCIHSLSYYA